MHVRPATPGDIDALLALGHQMHEESAYAYLPFERDKVRALVWEHLERPEDSFLHVAETGGRIVGMAMGYLCDYFFCHETIALDEVFFVEPEYRGSSAATRLLEAFCKWAAAAGASEVCLSVSTNVALERTGRFYRRMGFAQVGAIYKQRLR